MSSLIKIDKFYTVNFFDLSPSFNTDVHNHNDWELLYVDRGEVSCFIDGECIYLKQGELMVHSPHKIHRTVCNGKKSASIFNVHFISNSQALDYFNDKAFTVSAKTAEALKKLIDECNLTYRVSEHPMDFREDAPFGGEQMSLLLLEEFLILLIRESQCLKNSTCNTSLNQANNMPQIDEICNYLKSNVYGKITLTDISEKFHFSKSFLCEQFKNSKGISPISYYLDLKLIEAKRLLREDDITITEISEKLSFESPEYFSRYFKKRIGHSPRDFRKMLINDANLHKI